ncbi:N-6 DNA methylase [Brevibacillus formosus]|uniref:N-6 DNA methylase n=1 Tax=Brevibacillus formosus TaxID=54913 RepID=UPI0018CD7A86|nr:N-6 DNA methylase [Brevibacillus formosus]MBG9942316.1 hypothetical protein [Brevibacillus formosus]
MFVDKDKFKQYFTSNKLAQILVENVQNFVDPEHIIDLSVGSGELLLACNEVWESAKLFGIDIDNQVVNYIRNLYPEKIIIKESDALDLEYSHDFSEFYSVLAKGGFDLCVANPPFDSYYKIIIGTKTLMVPLEFLFLKKYIEVCKENGFIAIILPNGLLTNDTHKHLRDWILSKVSVKKIISLPFKAFPEVNAKTEILILEKKKALNEPAKEKEIIEFKEYNDDCNLVKVFTQRVSKAQLRERMDFHYYNHFRESKSRILNKNVHVRKLQDLLIEHGRGSTEYGEKRFFVHKGIRYIHTTNIGELCINFLKEELFVDVNSKMYKPKAHVKTNDVLFIRVGSNAGKTAVVLSDEETGVASDCLYIFRFNMDIIDPVYFNVLMKTEYMLNRLDLLRHGSCTRVISKGDLLKMEIPVLDTEMQAYFSNKFKMLTKINTRNDLDAFSQLKVIISELDECLWRGCQ